MFDIVVEINNTGLCNPITEHSAKKKNYFKDMDIVSEIQTKESISCIGYSHMNAQSSIYENDSRIIIVAGKVYPTNKAQELYGIDHEMTPNDISDLYESQNTKIVDYVKGNYALVIWEKNSKCALAYIGKTGLFKLYYYLTPQGVILSSSLDSIAQHPKYRRKINYTAVYEALLFGYPLGTLTYCEGIELLDNHSYLLYFALKHKCEIKPYFDYVDIMMDTPKYNWDETYKLTPDLFNKSVDVLAKGETRINAALTGGFDSRTVLSRLHKHAGTVQYYSWGATKQSIDVSIPERICNKFGLEYKWIQLGDDFLKEYSKYADELLFFTDGLGNIKRCNQMFSHKLLSSFARFNITGAIGSELLRPNNGLDTNIFPAMKDLVFANTLDIDKLDVYDFRLSKLLTPELILRTKVAAKEHIQGELGKFMKYDKPYLNLYNYTLSQSLWKFFGQEFHAARVFGFVVTPYSDDDFIQFIVQTPVPSINQRAFERNPKDLKAGQMFYLPILEKNMPQLLDVPTTRGYTPRHLTSKLYPLNIMIPFFWSRLYNKHFMAKSSYNAKDWNLIEYKNNINVFNYYDRYFKQLDLETVSDSEYSIKKWLIEYMGV